MGDSGDTHQKGEHVSAMADHHGDVWSPLPGAPVQEADLGLRPEGLNALKRVAKRGGVDRKGAYLHRDAGFDATHHRPCMFNAGMISNIPEHPRHRQGTKRGRTRLGNEAIHALRTRVERTYAWEDHFKRLRLRVAHSQPRHYGMPLLAYTLINLGTFWVP